MMNYFTPPQQGHLPGSVQGQSDALVGHERRHAGNEGSVCAVLEGFAHVHRHSPGNDGAEDDSCNDIGWMRTKCRRTDDG
jgi:hypothetical protein